MPRPAPPGPDLPADLRIEARPVAHLPLDAVLVGESGIHTRADVLRLQEAGVDAMLVGESLMAQDNIAAAVRILLGT